MFVCYLTEENVLNGLKIEKERKKKNGSSAAIKSTDTILVITIESNAPIQPNSKSIK